MLTIYEGPYNEFSKGKTMNGLYVKSLTLAIILRKVINYFIQKQD